MFIKLLQKLHDMGSFGFIGVYQEYSPISKGSSFLASSWSLDAVYLITTSRKVSERISLRMTTKFTARQ
jgi:hypothetical protein